MDKAEMREYIDKEQGEGFQKNIDISGYNFFKNKSFISFKMHQIDGFLTVNIKYIYAENLSDFLNILAYCINFWTGMKVKFIYYKEKQKIENKEIIKQLRSLGFREELNSPEQYRFKYICSKCCKDSKVEKDLCECKTLELYV